VHLGLTHLLAGLDRERLAAEVFLSGLGRTDVARMAQALFDPRQPAPAALLDILYTLTDGNPFFVEEVVKSLLSSRAFDPSAGVPPAELDVPRSVHDAVHRRTARLEQATLQVLTRAAIIGRRFEFGVLCEVTGMAETDLLDRLKELVDAQLLVEESADRFAFRHELTREAVNATLLRYERRNYHRLTAEAIERLYPQALDAHTADLAYHYFRAEVWPAALEYARRAGERALEPTRRARPPRNSAAL
jgi:predicted ATPase